MIGCEKNKQIVLLFKMLVQKGLVADIHWLENCRKVLLGYLYLASVNTCILIQINRQTVLLDLANVAPVFMLACGGRRDIIASLAGRGKGWRGGCLTSEECIYVCVFKCLDSGMCASIPTLFQLQEHFHCQALIRSDFQPPPLSSLGTRGLCVAQSRNVRGLRQQKTLIDLLNSVSLHTE